METITRRPDRIEDRTPIAVVTPPADAGKVLRVTATYLLSEDGRKASLLAGGDGRALQEISLDVPVNRLHLVTVDNEGKARLRLQPRFEHDSDRKIVRIDALPTYHAPPNVDDLFAAAARNLELERLYVAARHATRTAQRDAEQTTRDQLAQAFIADPAQRARFHPPPTPRRCVIVTDGRRVMFDASRDAGIAREVPAEAHRRFRADLRARHERAQLDRAAQLAIHEEKKRFVAEWIAEHGTLDQQARQRVGMLPLDEAIQTITDHAFASTCDLPRYERDGLDRLQLYLRQFPAYAEAVVTKADLGITSRHAQAATSSQWAFAQQLAAHIPQATVTLRVHRLTWTIDPRAPSLTIVGALAAFRCGPLSLRREFIVPDA